MSFEANIFDPPPSIQTLDSQNGGHIVIRSNNLGIDEEPLRYDDFMPQTFTTDESGYGGSVVLGGSISIETTNVLVSTPIEPEYTNIIPPPQTEVTNSFGVASITPTPHSHQVTADASISVAFNEELDPASISSGSFTVHSNLRGRLAGAISVVGKIIIFEPERSLIPHEQIEVVVTDQIKSVKGMASRPYIYRFRSQVKARSGRFEEAAEFGSPDSYDVALGDLDGDGDVDAFFASSGADSVWLNDGIGNFQQTAQRLGNTESLDVALGDFDRDGDLDAFVSGDHGAVLTVWRNEGLDSTGQLQFIALEQEIETHDGINNIEVGDIDRDGDLDAVLFGRQKIHIAQNDGLGHFALQQSIDLRFGSEIAFRDLGSLGDLDKNGNLDLVASGQYIEIARDLSNISSDRTPVTEQGGERTVPDISVKTGDLDNDGDLDAYTLAEEISIFPSLINNSETSQSTQPGRFIVLDGATNNFELGDLDGDGDLDAFAGVGQSGESIDSPGEWHANQILFNNGQATLNDSGQHLGDRHSRSVALADLNGDGTLDAIAVGPDGAELWFNQPVAPNDFDYDGRSEFLWRDQQTGGVQIWNLTEKIATTTEIKKRDDVGSSLQYLNWQITATADFDQDGQPELIGQKDNQLRIWFLHDHQVNYSEEVQLLEGMLLSDWTIEAAEDFNGDRRPDLLLRDRSNGALHVHSINQSEDGNWLLAEGERLGPTIRDPSWKVATTGDFNGDNQIDIVWQNHQTWQSLLWLMDGLTPLRAEALPTSGQQGWGIIGSGDYNIDGQTDLFVRNQDHQTEVWLMSQGQRIDRYSIEGKVASHWVPVS